MNLPAIYLDKEGYPTDEFLDWIKSYDTVFNDPFVFIQIILDHWWMNYGVKIQRKYRGERKVFMSTGGWSGNEEIISSLQENKLFWAVHYFAHQRGGHFTFIFSEWTDPATQQ